MHLGSAESTPGAPRSEFKRRSMIDCWMLNVIESNFSNMAELSRAEDESSARYPKSTQENKVNKSFKEQHAQQAQCHRCGSFFRCGQQKSATLTKRRTRRRVAPFCCRVVRGSHLSHGSTYRTVSWTGHELGSSAFTTQSRAPSTTSRCSSSFLKTRFRRTSSLL